MIYKIQLANIYTFLVQTEAHTLTVKTSVSCILSVLTVEKCKIAIFPLCPLCISPGKNIKAAYLQSKKRSIASSSSFCITTEAK